jgi:DNA-directed RNA polymerase omega subunit
MLDEPSEPSTSSRTSIFHLVRLTSLRAKQLQAGARPRVEPNGDKVLRIALREVLAGLVSWNVDGAEKKPVEAPAAAAP